LTASETSQRQTMGKLHEAAKKGELDDAKRLIGEKKGMVHEKDTVSGAASAEGRGHSGYLKPP
jgi:hypothetical protein